MTAPTTAAKRGRKPRFNDRRMEILRTAARTFADKGYALATLEDIAGALGMTRAALYYYAESKDQLLSACMDVARVSLDESLELAGGQGTGVEQVRVYFRAHVALGCDDFGRCFLLMDDRDLSEPLRETSVGWRRSRNRRVEEMLRQGMSDGSFAKGDVVALRRLLFAIMNAVPLWVKSSARGAPEKAADEALDAFLTGLSPRS